MDSLLFIIFGTAPSLIWLMFYLHEDAHPEPKRTILNVFFWGMLATIPVLAVELLIRQIFPAYILHTKVSLFLYILFGIALVEEIAKFLVIRWKVYSSKALDEPIDLMLYMIIAALGFSALENIFVLFGLGQEALLSDIFAVSFFRFLGATFLHALSSGIFGYFLVLSFLNEKERLLYTFLGLGLATLLHTAFNLFIMEAQGPIRFFGPLAIFTLTMLFIAFAFSRLKHMKSICKI